MMIALWLCAGGAVGVLNALNLCWTVARVQSATPAPALTWVLGGALLRWGLTAGLLIAALRHGIVPGLVAFIGLWITHWLPVAGCGLLEQE
jgi:hypothetical protein